MMKTILYPRVPEGQCLGRNRLMQTGGIEIMNSDFGREVWLYPMTSKHTGSNACKVVIPVESIDDVIAGLKAFQPERQGVDPRETADTLPAGRLARLVARWRGVPFLAIG